MKKTERIDIRLTKPDKEKCERVLNDINKTRNKKVGYRFLLMEFVEEYLNNNVRGLEIEKNNLIKENEKDQEQLKEITERITRREIKIKEYNNRINNKTIYHENNFKENENLTKAIKRIKEIIFNPDSNINNFNDVQETLFLQMQDTFKINVTDLKNIVKYNFERWQQEEIINEPEPQEKTYNEKIDQLLKMFNRSYNGNEKAFNNKLKYLEHNKEKYKTMCEKQEINYIDFEKAIKNDVK